MKISVITDELSSDLDTALELACEMGFEGIELRGIGDGRYPRVSALDDSRVPALLAECGLPVVSVSPGLFKLPHPDVAFDDPPVDPRVLRWDDALDFADRQEREERFRLQFESLLPQVIAAARSIGAPLINAFSFDRAGAPRDASIPAAVVATLKQAARLAAREGLSLSIENEATTWASTAASAAALIAAVDEPNLGLTWDPANAFRAGDDAPFPEGYAKVAGMIRHVHVKNAARSRQTGDRRFQFDGEVDWPGQLAALRADGFSGFLSVETHQRPKIASTRQYLAMLRAAVDRTR
jgi:sugar phosphate isomerase/epimerase